MAPVDIWFWVVTVVLAALIAMIIVGARRSRSRIDPTNVSIDPALAGRVRDLMAKGDKVKAVKELREATGLGLGDAIRIAEKMAPAKAAGGGASGRRKTAHRQGRRTPPAAGTATGCWPGSDRIIWTSSVTWSRRGSRARPSRWCGS
jgi:hypothetical protein